jgi:hypothetical protein
MLDIACLLAYSIANLFRNAEIPESQKPLWGVILLLAAPFTLPVYWYMHIRRANAPIRSLPGQV